MSAMIMLTAQRFANQKGRNFAIHAMLRLEPRALKLYEGACALKQTRAASLM
jgi:hypothetical protein